MPSLHRTIREIDAKEWDHLAGENAFATHGWLSTVETCWRADVQPLYFTLRRDGALVAASVCYVFTATREIETLDDMCFGRLTHAARVLGISFLPAVVCGPALGYGWHIGVDRGLCSGDADEARRLVLEAIQADADARGLQVSFVHVLDEERDLKDLLETRGYLRCRHVPVGVLDVRWDSFEEYLTSLPRKSRAEFRRQINRNREAGSVIEIEDSSREVEGRLQELLDRNARKYGALRFACGEGFFSALKCNLGQRARVFTARKSGVVTAVSVMLVHNETGFVVAVGVDPAVAGDDYTYFQLTYYSLIAHAIESGIRRLYYGRGMYEIKVRRGCRMTNSWIYSRESGARRIVSAPWFALASFWNRCKLSTGARRALMR